MSLGGATVLVGGGVGLALAIFGATILVTGRAPGVTTRVFRAVRDAAMYHLLFGLALLVLAVGASLPGGAPGMVSAVLAIGMVGVAVIRYRPRGRKAADHQ
jgi:hypothetical protein